MRGRSELARAIDKEGPMRVAGHIWQNHGGSWQRYLVRRHLWSQRSIVDGLIFVNSDQAFCPRCLGARVVVTASVTAAASAQSLDCLDCKLVWSWAL